MGPKFNRGDVVVLVGNVTHSEHLHDLATSAPRATIARLMPAEAHYAGHYYELAPQGQIVAESNLHLIERATPAKPKPAA